MKKHISLLFLAASLAFIGNAQLKVKSACPEFVVDVLDGKVNGLKPNA
ncbi:MAG: hypothetical protein WCF67_24965 [Chitinophagaceae bacterium]